MKALLCLLVFVHRKRGAKAETRQCVAFSTVMPKLHRTAWELCAVPNTRVTQSNPRRGGIRVDRWPRPHTDHSAWALVTTKANHPLVGVHASAIKSICHAYAVYPVETQLQANPVSAGRAHAAVQLVSMPAGKPAGPYTSAVAPLVAWSVQTHIYAVHRTLGDKAAPRPATSM